MTITRGLLVDACAHGVRNPNRLTSQPSSSPVIVHRSGPDEPVAVKPLRKATLECLRAAHGETHPPRLGEAYTSLHVDQERLDIQILITGPTRQPSLTPVGELAHEPQELLARFGELVFGALHAVETPHDANYCERLQTLGEHRSRDAWNPAADIIEPPTAAQELADYEQGPSSAQHLMGSCDGAELAVT